MAMPGVPPEPCWSTRPEAVLRSFRELAVWRKAHALALLVYGATETFPPWERYDLVRQLRRCAVSIPANLAEGCGRRTVGELRYHLGVAMGSASELEYFLQLSLDLGFIDEQAHGPLDQRTREVKRMLVGFMNSLNG